MTLSQQQIVLRAICDTFIPSLISPDGSVPLFWKRTASDLNIHERLGALIATHDADAQKQFSLLLRLFESPFVGFWTVGTWKPFSHLPREQRERWLKKWSVSRSGILRQGFSTLKKLTCFLYYADTTGTGSNPNWADVGYPGPLTPPPVMAKPIKPLVITGDTELECDVVVVGSGAGGGVVAGELAKVGKDVIVVEKGVYYNESDFTEREAEMMAALYEKQGLLTSADGAVLVLAGSCLGGGTTINWAGSIPTPQYILEEWAKEHAAPHFLSAAYQHSIQAAAAAIHTNTQVIHHGGQNQKLWAGSEKLGLAIKPIPQNSVGPAGDDYREFGYSLFGDQERHKQSTLLTYLEPAAARGARFLTQTDVDHVMIERGRAAGVVAYQRTGTQRPPQKITIRARQVVVCAGTIHTPALLLRSGLRHPEIGKNLHLHPTVAVSGWYPEAINPWWGMMMTATNDEFVHLDGNYGFKIETPPVHVGLFASGIPWRSGRDHKMLMLEAKQRANFIVLTRDKYGGSVTLSRFRQPVIHYQLHPYDQAHMLKGLVAATRVQFAAGADRVIWPHNEVTIIGRTEESKLEEIAQRLPWKPNYYTLFSAHQMGTCRMGGIKETHPVSPTGETYEVKNLFVADGSTLPASSGVNPMLSIEALAHYIAQGLK